MNKKRYKKIIQFLAVKMAWLFVLFWGRTGRVRVKNRAFYMQACRSGRPILFLLWHGRMLLPFFIHRNQNIVAMVSEHGDGEIIARTARRLGFRSVRGSSTRGGQKAFRDMLKHLKGGEQCTVLPDGPQGPRFVVKMGAIMLAQRANALIVPLTFSASNPIILNSWDRFMLWKPFSRVIIMYGAPIQIPRNINPDELEEYRLFVERAMQRLHEEADALV